MSRLVLFLALLAALAWAAAALVTLARALRAPAPHAPAPRASETFMPPALRVVSYVLLLLLLLGVAAGVLGPA